MNKPAAAIFFLLITTFFIASCDQCENRLIGTLYLTELDKKIVPYTGQEMLVFADTLGDSIVFTDGIRSSDVTEGAFLQYPQGGSDGTCYGDYYNAQNTSITFPRTQEGKYFNFFLSSGNPFQENVKKKIGIRVVIDTSSQHFDTSFSFDSLLLFEIAPYKGRIVSLNDTLVIGPKVFHDVYWLEDDNSNSEPVSVFYSVAEGLVGFRTGNGKTWYLK